jgi:hypothetical protein
MSQVAVAALAAVLFLWLTLSTGRQTEAQAPAASHTAGMGYGFNVAQLDLDLLTAMGFNWVKIFGPPGYRMPVHVLIRVEADATHLNNLAGFSQSVRQLALTHGAHIEAYEIGNEVNLDAAYGWTTSPNAADYVTLLCAAYSAIKEVDPGSVVVSAGLAPTGRVSGNWNGHPGHNGLYQDEREFLKEFFTAGGGACLDAVGYHPYGFSADYDVAPDTNGGTPPSNCTNGFCFRGSEKIYEIMQSRGYGHKKIWATEFGWLTPPPDHCLNDPGWAGRQWQIVTLAKQAGNLAGAFQYAELHWPWMEAMFVFNLNFNTTPWYDECEQMRFYGVAGRPAEAALRDLPKNIAPGRLVVGQATLVWLLAVSEQPASVTMPLVVRNEGGQSLIYTTTAAGNAALVPTLQNASGELAPGGQRVIGVTFSSNGRAAGTYTGTLTINASSVSLATAVLDTPQTVDLRLYVVPQVHRVYLPVLNRP